MKKNIYVLLFLVSIVFVPYNSYAQSKRAEDQMKVLAIFSKKYVSDSLYYRAVGAGRGSDQTTARLLAIKNAEKRIIESVSPKPIKLVGRRELHDTLFYGRNNQIVCIIAIEVPKKNIK